jgi:hypothetical protein
VARLFLLTKIHLAFTQEGKGVVLTEKCKRVPFTQESKGVAFTEEYKRVPFIEEGEGVDGWLFMTDGD